MFSLHRCGIDLPISLAGRFSHPACHTTPARLYGSGDFVDVSGGWHDAGDYGRYVVPGAKAAVDLMLAYACAPAAFDFSLPIPESGGEIPDILHEIRYELNWLSKMQQEDGGVYHKVTCAVFPGFVMPEEEQDELLLTPVSTAATADFVLAMAVAYIVFLPCDRVFATECLEQAKQSYWFLKNTPPRPFSNPPGIITGEYPDECDADERYAAACALYYATGDASYLADARALYLPGRASDFGWEDMGGYGDYLLLNALTKYGSDHAFKAELEQNLLSTAEEICRRTEESPWGVSLSTLPWGSNMYLLSHTMALLMAFDQAASPRFLACARKHVAYLLGNNPLNQCYFTGHCAASPQHPHHRPSAAMDAPMPGMLVGGPDEGLHDPVAGARLQGREPLSCYLDELDSYSTNEVAIYWNSALVYVLARLVLCDKNGQG